MNEVDAKKLALYDELVSALEYALDRLGGNYPYTYDVLIRARNLQEQSK